MIDKIEINDSCYKCKIFDKMNVDVVDEALEYVRTRLYEMCGVGDTITIKIKECDDGM